MVNASCAGGRSQVRAPDQTEDYNIDACSFSVCSIMEYDNRLVRSESG